MGFFGKSVLEKSRERSRAKKSLHGNYTSGHVTPNEHYLERAGLRGRKIWLCCYFFTLIYLLAIVHLTVTCLILGVLRFNESGFPYFSFGSASTLWERGAYINKVAIATPHGVSGYNDAPLVLSAQDDNQIQLETTGLTGLTSHLSLNKSALNMTIEESLRVTDISNGEQLLFANASLLQINEVNSIRSSRLTLKGVGGVRAIGGVVNITGVNRVNLTGQGLTLNGHRGIVVPRLIPHTPSPPSSSTKYHLCVRADGTLFLVPTNPLRCQATP